MKLKRLRFHSTAMTVLFGIAAGTGQVGAEIEVGDTEAQVRQELGEPAGTVAMNGQVAYSFDRGHVVLRDGRVVSHSIVSEAEAQQLREAEEQRRQQRMEEGSALRDRMKEDASFANASARERLAFWEVFRTKYPEVDVSFERSVAARQVLAQEQEASRELQGRLIEAEKMAELADQREPAHPAYYRTGFPLIFDPFGARVPDKDGFRHGFKSDPGFPVQHEKFVRPSIREQNMPLQSAPSFMQPVRSASPAKHHQSPRKHSR